MDDADFNPGSSVSAASPRADFSFWRAFGRHWRASLHYYGWRHTVAQVGQAAYRYLCEFLPGRRQAKYGDLDYDFEHMVDTTRANVGFGVQLAAALSGHQYFPTEPWLFEEIMQAIPIQFEDFTFVDLGSGKGRALMMAAPYGFRRILGVEFMPEWHRIAQENIRKFTEHCAAGNKPALAIESVCMDARDFELPAGPLVVYFFNAFPEPVLAEVLERLQRSWQENHRPVFVAYRYPEFEQLLHKSGWLEKIAGTEQWALYRNLDDRVI